MATTEADIPEPVCETIKEEEKRNMVDQAANKVTKEEKTSTDNKPYEPPKTLEINFDVKDVEKSNEGSASTIESEIFLKSPLIAEVSIEAKNLSPDACKVTEKPEKIMKDDTDISPLGNAKLDDQPLDITASEEIILKEIKENAEESNGKYGEKSVTSVPSTVDSALSNLGTKAGEIIYDPGQEDIKVEIQMSKETSTEDDGTTNSFTTETGSPEENLYQTSLQSRESKGSEIPNISEVKNLNPKVTTPNDESGRMKTTKDEIPCILVTDMSTEGENPNDQNEAANGNSEKNAEEVAGSFLKSKTTTDETSSENAVEEEMSYDGSKKTGLPILIERANEEIKERKNGNNAKNLSCSPLVTAEIEEISSEQDGLGNELHNNAEEASQEKNLDREAVTAVIPHEYELQGENESESSFLKKRDDIHIQKGDKTVTTPEYSEKIMEIAGKKSQEEVENQSKTQEENITIHANPTGTEETEENALIQNDGSQMKDEVHLEKEKEKSCFTDVSMRDTSDNESTAKNEDEELREAELSENKKDMESALVVNATTEKNTESLKVSPEDVEPYISFQNTETTSSLEEKNQTANLQEILCDKIGLASDVVDRKEETLKKNLTLVPNEETEENSTIEVDGSQMKGEEHLEEENKMACITEALATDISNNKSTLMLEDKMKDADLRKDELIKNQTGSESSMLNQEGTMEKPIDSLQVAPEDIKASTSDQDTKTSSLENQILTDNPQEILDDKTESKTCGVANEEKETLEVEAVPTIELNGDKEDNSVIKEYDSEMKYEESLEKEYEKPSVKEDSIRDAIDDKSTYMQEDKFEDKDLRKAEIFENKKDIENTLLKEETTVMKPIEFLQLDPEEIRTYASDHGTETTSLNASSRDGIAEDITIDAADMKGETVENVTTIVLNEDIEEKPTITMDSSQIKQEENLEREGQIPLTIEALTGKTGDVESIINHVDNTEHEDLRKAELLESEKNTESTLLNKETQMEIPIKSLQVVAEDIIASASCLESTSSHQERKLNAHENLSQHIEDKTINAADTKEKTPEAQNATTIFSNEMSKEENSLIQIDESKIKHEELLEKEGKMLSLSETLVVETNNEESKIIHEDKNAESTLLKEGLQVDKPIKSLKVGFEDNEASVSCQDREATNSLMDQSITANPNEIMGEPTEEKITDAGDTKEKTPEVQQNFTTIVSNENAEKNSLIQVDASQEKHEELFENEREIPALSETLMVESNNQESTVIQEDEIEDENIKKVAEYESETHIENTFLNEEARVDMPIESLNIAPEDGKASASCQETETSSLEERSLRANSQEIEGNQTEHKIIDATNTKEKSQEVQDFATILTNENSEDISLLQMDGSQMKHEILLEKEREIPSLSENSVVETNNQESVITHEKKIEDEDLKKDMFESERHAECTLSKEEGHIGKCIKSLQEAPEDNKASCQHIETTSSLKESSLIANTQFDDQIENQVSVGPDTKEETHEAWLQGLATVMSNEKTEEISSEKETEIPSLSEASIVETNNEESTVMHEVKIENKDLEKHAESTLLKEDARVNQHIESLLATFDENETSVSCQDPETTCSLEDQTLTEKTQEIVGGQTEDKIIDTAETKEKTLEAQQNSTTSVSNENAEKKKLIQVDASEKKHEEFFENEREIPALSEPLTVETNNQVSTVIQEDEIEDEDLQKVDAYEQEKRTSLKEEAQLDKPIESLQAAPGDSKESASCQDTETSFLEEGSLIENPKEINGDQTEDKIIDVANAKEKTTETHLQNFATVASDNIEENSLLQMDGSKIKHEELLNKESEIPSSSETLAVNTNNEEPKIIHEDKDAGSTLSKEEVQADQHIESLKVALEENEASVSCQDPETTCSLEEQRLIENTQELVSGQTEDKIIDTVHIKEKTPEAHNSTTIVSNENAGKNSLIQVDAAQKKHEELIENDKEVPVLSQTFTAETNNEESIIIHEDKTEDQEVKRVDECESEKQRESTFLHEEAQAGKLFESLHLAPEDCKVSCQDTETSSFLEELSGLSLTKNPQEIVGDQIEEKINGAANTKEKTSYTNDFAMIVTNDKTDDDLLLQMDGSQLKHEELLEKEGEAPFSSETLAEEVNNEESAIIHKDKFEDEDLKTVDVFEEKHAICTLSMEQSCVDEPIEPLQVAPEDIKSSCQHLEKTSSPKEQSVTAYPQFANQTEDKIYDAPDTKGKTPEAQGFAVVSNENIEENAQIQVDESKIRHEEVLETKREISSLSETLTVETNNEGTAIIHEDKIEVENLKNDDIFESEKYAESNLLKGEEWVHQVASEDVNASALCEDRETRISLEDQSPTANPQEVVGDQAHAETIDAADTKAKTREVQVSTILDPTTIISGENAENNSLIQLEASQKKHEEQTESETPTLSDTLMVESDNEKSTTIHEDKIEDKDLKEDDGYKNAETRVDTSIESLEGVPEVIKASPSCLDTETISSLEERSPTVNPQEILGDQTEDTIIDAADTKEESLETQDFATNETNDKIEGNSLFKMDGSQLKHEELLEKEREMPSLSETLAQEANNEESTILHKDKFEDEDQKTVDTFENEKFIESTPLKEETKVGKHVESLQITPEDFKASASCQDRDTTSTLVEQSLTANVQETVSEQTEDKIIATADTKDKTPDALKNVTKITSNEDNESAIPCYKSSDLDPTNQLKEDELNDSNAIQETKVPEGDYIPSLVENMIEKMNRKESEAAEDATDYKHTENLQHEDTTESIMDDLKHLEPTEKDKEESECNVTLNQTMEKTKSTLAVNDHSATERELTIDTEEMHIGKTAKDGDEAAKIDKDDEEEENGKKNVSDFSSEAPIMIEAKDEEVARLVYEAADEKITSGVAEESSILDGVTETGDSKVLKGEMTQEDTLDTVKSIEGLEIISHEKDPEILTTTSKVIKGQEVGNLSVSETSVLVSQSGKDNLDVAQIGSVTEEKFKSNEVDFADRESTSVCESNDQGVEELKSLEITTIGNKSEKNDKEINRDDGTRYKTKNESVEETQDDINYVPEKQELQDSVSLSKELPFKTSSKMEKTTYDGEANEDSVELGEEETLKDVGNWNYNARTKEDNDTVNSISESSETVEPENMEVVTETVAQLQNCELISKVEDPYTKEDKLEEAAAEIKSGKILAEDILDPKETMKLYVSTNKVKEETEGANHHIGSCKGEIVLDNYCQEDEVKPEDDSRINTEEIFEAIKNADENKKVSKVLGESNAADNINEQTVFDDKAVEEPDEIIQANEPKDGHQQEKEKSVDRVTTGLDTKEKEHELDYLIEKTSIEDPREEVNSSILVFQEKEDNRTGANDINNIMTKDAELLTMNNKNANTTMMELQEHCESKHGSLLPSEVLQVQDSEKQDKMDETFSSDKVQGKDEISMPQEKETISASKSDVEADRVDNLSRITEDENNKNKIEVELIEHDSKAKAVTAESGTDSVDVTETGGENGQEENASDDCEGMAEPSTSMVSTEIMQEHATGDRENKGQLTKLYELPLLSHVEDSEVGMAQKQGPVNLQSGSGTADNVQDLIECCFTVSNMGNLQAAISDENVEVKVSSGRKEADIVQQDLVSNTVKQEIPEQQLANTVENVSEERGINSEEDEIKDASCNDSQENSSGVDTDKVAPSNILQGSIVDEAREAKSQETERQHSSLPILPHTEFSDMEIAQKDIPLHFAKKDEDDLKELEAAPLPTTDKPIVLEADHADNASSNISMLQHRNSSGSSLTKGEKQEPSKFEKEEEKCEHEETTKPMKTEQSTEIDNHSLSDLLQLSGKETLQVVDHFTVKPTIQKEDLWEGKSNEAAHEETKTDEEKDDEVELSEHKSSDMSSEAPVMVEAGDTDVKVAHKKSHNILSGVGSKVKHSIAKVKKAITGKSSHPKSHSPKYGEKI